MLLTILKEKIANSSEIIFEDVMRVIAENYHYSPARFSNGIGDDCVINEAGMNEGSCKIFAFAQLQSFTQDQTLRLFGKYYRDDVLLHPEGDDHANIRTFMRHGWQGVTFDNIVLKAKPLSGINFPEK